MMRDQLKQLRLLFDVVGVPRSAVFTMLCLGLAASFFEGVGLYLFVPLLASLDHSSSSAKLPGFLASRLANVAPIWQTVGLVSILLSTVFLKSIISYANNANFARKDSNAAHELRVKLYGDLLAANVHFLESQPKGRTANALLSETWQCSRALGIFFNSLVDLSAVVILSAVLLYLSWEVTLLVVPTVLLIALVVTYLARMTQRYGEAAARANRLFAGKTWEGLAGLRTIRLFGQTAKDLLSYSEASAEMRRQFLNLQYVSNFTAPAFECSIATAISLWILALAALGTGVPTLAVYLLVLYRLQPRIKALISARVSLLELGSAIRDLQDLRRECERSRLQAGNEPFGGVAESITFRHVRFSYPNAEAVALNDVSFKIPANSSIAIVGRSGAGKSTIVDLLCRFIQPAAGAILIDGRSLSTIDLHDWYNHLAVVNQDAYLFNTTIEANIRFGRAGSSSGDVVDAAVKAGAHEFIESLPQGYQTEVGDRGIRLSGGSVGPAYHGYKSQSTSLESLSYSKLRFRV